MKVLILGGDSMLAYALKQVFCFEKLVAFGHQTCDITDPTQVDRHLANLMPEVVINCAAYTDVDMAQTSPNMCELVNAMAVKSLAEQCRKHNCSLVHFSTEMVFGQEDEFGYDEDHKPRNPVNVYGRTKLAGERYLRETWRNHWLVRTSWLFGPGGDNFIDRIIRKAKEGREIDVVNDQWGCPTYTFDLAHAVYSLVRNRASYGIYHLANGGSTSKSKFAWEIIDHTVGDCHVREVSSKSFLTLAKRPKHSVLNNTRRTPLRPWSNAMVEYLIGIGEMFKHR